jgi:hypothetical protein
VDVVKQRLGPQCRKKQSSFNLIGLFSWQRRRPA